MGKTSGLRKSPLFTGGECGPAKVPRSLRYDTQAPCQPNISLSVARHVVGLSVVEIDYHSIVSNLDPPRINVQLVFLP